MRRLSRSVKAASPAISTVILTGTIVSLLAVAVVYVNGRLWTSLAESDFNSAKQFMQSIGLQIDDVAWVLGRKATIRYSSVYGNINYLQSALNYSVYTKAKGSTSYQFLASYKVGVLLFNVPVSKFTLYDGYFEMVYPRSADSLTLTGAAAPVARVFCTEKVTPAMSDGSYVRVVVAPSIRSLFSNMTAGGASTYYIRLYLPVLVEGSAHGLSQSVTLTGSSVTASTRNQISSVMVTVSFPSETSQKGFDASFFRFSNLTQVISVPAGYDDAMVELYAGEVKTELGVHS